MRTLVIVLTLLYSVGASAQDAAKPLVIAAGRIPHVFDPDQPGSYNRIFDLMVRGLARPVDIRFFPLTHAMRQMAKPEYHCFAMALNYSPNWARLGLSAADYTFVGPIAWLEIKVYRQAGDGPSAEQALLGQRIAADETIVNLRSTFSEGWAGANITGTPSFVDALEQVAAGQYDAALAYDMDVGALADDHPLVGKIVDTGITVAKLQDGVMCKSTTDMLPVILRMQESLDELAADGTLDQLLAVSNR